MHKILNKKTRERERERERERVVPHLSSFTKYLWIKY